MSDPNTAQTIRFKINAALESLDSLEDKADAAVGKVVASAVASTPLQAAKGYLNEAKALLEKIDQYGYDHAAQVKEDQGK